MYQELCPLTKATAPSLYGALGGNPWNSGDGSKCFMARGEVWWTMVNYGEHPKSGSSPRDTATRSARSENLTSLCSTEHPKRWGQAMPGLSVFSCNADGRLDCKVVFRCQPVTNKNFFPDHPDHPDHPDGWPTRRWSQAVTLHGCSDEVGSSTAVPWPRGHPWPTVFHVWTPPRPPWNKPGRKPSKRERQNIWGPLWEPPSPPGLLSYWIVWLEITWP